MGRVKIAPTPRNMALNDAMRRAGANVTSSSSLKVELARPDPLPALPPRGPTKVTSKSVKSTQPTTRISRDSAKDRSSVDSQKRKSESAESSAPPSKKPATEKLVLRSSTHLAPTSQGEAITTAISRDTSVRSNNSAEPTRRSTRSKAAANVDAVSAVEPAREVPASSPRLIRAQKKTSKADASVTPEEKERQQAIAMLQGNDVYTEDEDIDAAELSALARRPSGSESSPPSASTPATPPQEPEPDEELNTLVPEPSFAIETPAPVDVAAKVVLPSENLVVATREVDNFKLDTLDGLPSRSDVPAPAFGDYSANIIHPYSAPPYPRHAYPDPSIAPVAFSYIPPVVNGLPNPPQNGYVNSPVDGFPSTPMNVYTNSHYLAPDQGPVDGSSATSGDSGYATSQPPTQSAYMNGKATPFPTLAPATPGSRPIMFVNCTKGQKVKGRPTPRNPKPREVTPRAGRNIANTYPRKQPFKAQIEFPAYPPAGSEIPADYSLWEICQNYPNSLREHVLLGFVQREWSANELCACLKEDARDILNSRPGKDKTMVFQKRMERIKKDLVAKGEYQNLLNGPMVREDGRPTWVKRGNVRRK